MTETKTIGSITINFAADPAPKTPAPDPKGLRKRLNELLAEYGMEGTVQAVDFRRDGYQQKIAITSHEFKDDSTSVKHVLELTCNPGPRHY